MVFTDGPVAPGDGLVFGGPYQGFSPSSQPGETDKNLLVENHIRVFKEQVGRLAHLSLSLTLYLLQVVAAQEFSPTLVNCHALKDYFTAEMAEQFFTDVLAWQKENNYNVYHETHRKRFLHSPWVARSFVEKYPDMKVTTVRHHSDLT